MRQVWITCRYLPALTISATCIGIVLALWTTRYMLEYGLSHRLIRFGDYRVLDETSVKGILLFCVIAFFAGAVAFARREYRRLSF